MRRLAAIFLWCGTAAIPPAAGAGSVPGFAATVQPLATAAALEAFAQGGNAIDAAVAAGLTLGVVDGHNSGIGGGCFILLRLADGRLVCLDGRETAPAAATRDMFLRDGKAVDALSRVGPLASGVPGALAAYARAVEDFGRLPLARAFQAGIRHAEEGFASTVSTRGSWPRRLPTWRAFPPPGKFSSIRTVPPGPRGMCSCSGTWPAPTGHWPGKVPAGFMTVPSRRTPRATWRRRGES
jgi:gamma-glutamyltranspeptidase